MKKLQLMFTCLLISTSIIAQSDMKLPYDEIPAYPDKYTAETVVARMIDGLGFRYYWATEGLRPEDLSFKPSAEARTTEETIDHIYGLTKVIVNAMAQMPNDRSVEEPEYSYEEKRKLTLNNLKKASDILMASKEGSLKGYILIFKSKNGQSEYPFWNNINGPIEDAVWHVGQVVTHRRSSGNPFNSKVSVFSGKLRD